MATVLPIKGRMISPRPVRVSGPKVHRPRRVPVTVALGCVYDEGIVFCADTKVTTSVKTNESKLSYYESDDHQCALVFTIASDDVIFPKAAIERCWEMVRKMDFSVASLEDVRNTAEFSLAEFYRDHIYLHPDRVPGSIYFEMLVGIWLRNETRLYALHETVLTSVGEHECIGAGAYLSQYIIKQYKKANPGKTTLADATLLADVCVNTAIEYDERCGGEAEILIVRNSGQISNSYQTAVYPNYLVREFQSEMWKFVRELAMAQTRGTAAEDADGLVDAYCERIRRVESPHRKYGSGGFP